MEKLAEHFTERRHITRTIELNKINISERTRKTVVKHKWYLQEKNSMIRNLFILDYNINNILANISVIAFTLLIQQMLMDRDI